MAGCARGCIDPLRAVPAQRQEAVVGAPQDPGLFVLVGDDLEGRGDEDTVGNGHLTPAGHAGTELCGDGGTDPGRAERRRYAPAQQRHTERAGEERRAEQRADQHGPQRTCSNGV